MMAGASASAERGVREALSAAYRQLGTLGLTSGTAGNVSARFEEGMIISPAGASASKIAPEHFVKTALDGVTLGEGVKSSEWSMHAEIYKRKPEAQAVVHAHPDACVALSCHRKPIPSFHYMIAAFGGNDVPCSRYATFGSIELAHAAVDALEKRSACLLANHGMICFSSSLDSAIANALKLETLARQYLLSLQAGAPVLLSNAEMEIVRQKYVSYGR
jgi:L-fuculose-phosphate aldolase